MRTLITDNGFVDDLDIIRLWPHLGTNITATFTTCFCHYTNGDISKLFESGNNKTSFSYYYLYIFNIIIIIVMVLLL